jgi:tyrosyl-tRNA synthetase
LHPKQAKVDLARRLVTDFHSVEEADRAAAAFEARFSRGELSEDLPVETVDITEDRISLAKVVKAAGLAESTSDATRKIQQGAVRVDREKVTDTKAWIDEKRREIVLQVGRRAVRVKLNRA